MSSLKTDAGIVAKHFINATAGRATPAIMKKTTVQAKSLLESGYSKEEIIDVIDYLINEQKAQIYSLGYVVACINDVLRKLKNKKTIEESHKLKQLVAAQATQHEKQRNEVVSYDDSGQRNKLKAGRFGVRENKWESLFGD